MALDRRPFGKSIITVTKVGRQQVPLAEGEHQHLMEVFVPYARRLTFYRGVF